MAGGGYRVARTRSQLPTPTAGGSSIHASILLVGATDQMAHRFRRAQAEALAYAIECGSFVLVEPQNEVLLPRPGCSLAYFHSDGLTSDRC